MPAAEALPRGRDGARIAHANDRIEISDIDAEFEGRGSHNAAQAAGFAAAAWLLATGSLTEGVRHAAAGLKPQSLLPSYGMAEATLAMSFIGLDEELKVDHIDTDRYHSDQKAAPGKGDEISKSALIRLSAPKRCGRPVLS